MASALQRIALAVAGISMVMALLRAKLEGQKKSAQGDHGVGRDLDTAAGPHFVERSRLDVLRGQGRGLGRDGFGLDWR